MRNLLAKFLPKEQVESIVAAFKAANPGVEDLPKHHSKEDLDKVTIERDDFKTKYDAIPKDWQQQIAKEKARADKAIADAATDTELYKAKARNLTAVRALIDPAKPLADEIKRLQKDEAYLFGGDAVPPDGTWKQGNGGDDKKSTISENSMRSALGLAPKETK